MNNKPQLVNGLADAQFDTGLQFLFGLWLTTQGEHQNIFSGAMQSA